MQGYEKNPDFRPISSFISQMIQDMAILQNANRKPYWSFRMVPFSMTLNDLVKYSITWGIAQSLCNSWASCIVWSVGLLCIALNRHHCRMCSDWRCHILCKQNTVIFHYFVNFAKNVYLPLYCRWQWKTVGLIWDFLVRSWSRTLSLKKSLTKSVLVIILTLCKIFMHS